MLWGRTATSSPSLVFSKTFTSTNYPGKRKTKKQHLSWAESNFICIRQRSEALNSSTRDHEEIKIREAAFFHNPQHPQRPTRCTHMSACVRVHTHTHQDPFLRPCHSLPKSLYWVPEERQSCRMALGTREKRRQQFTAEKSHNDTTWIAYICSDTHERIYLRFSTLFGSRILVSCLDLCPSWVPVPHVSVVPCSWPL